MAKIRGFAKLGPFTSYAKDDFTEHDQVRLHDFIVALHHKGVAVMLSNSKTPFIQHLYSEPFFTQHTVTASRFVNCKANARGEVHELLITTYETMLQGTKANFTGNQLEGFIEDTLRRNNYGSLGSSGVVISCQNKGLQFMPRRVADQK